MKPKVTNALQIVFGLVTLAMIGWGTYLIAAAIASGLMRMRSDLAVAIVAASATATASVVVVVISKRFEARSVVVQGLRDRKIPIYESIIATLFKVQNAKKLGEAPPSSQDL